MQHSNYVSIMIELQFANAMINIEFMALFHWLKEQKEEMAGPGTRHKCFKNLLCSLLLYPFTIALFSP